jgi:hypothetical protein
MGLEVIGAMVVAVVGTVILVTRVIRRRGRSG